MLSKLVLWDGSARRRSVHYRTDSLSVTISLHKMDCLSIYIDKPLDNIDGAIRLVAILPGRHDDKIYCELRLDHLLGQDNPPKYEALSYVWGTQEYPMEILLDNQPF